MHRIVFAAALLLPLLGCGPPPAPEGPFGIRNRAILTVEEIRESQPSGWTAHDLIAQLRPEYLRSRGASSLRDPAPVTATVYLDNVRFGSLETLKVISADQIRRVEYINAADATTRFGTNHLGGAILILTK